MWALHIFGLYKISTQYRDCLTFVLTKQQDMGNIKRLSSCSMKVLQASSTNVLQKVYLGYAISRTFHQVLG